MQHISLIAAIDENYGIGINQQLLCHLPVDLKHFKQLTLNKTIIMGRKTFDSIGRVLPERRNMILSRQELFIPGAQVTHTLDEALQKADDSEIMIIGGATLFKEAMPVAEHLYITHIHHCFAADVFFPPIDLNVWLCAESIFCPKNKENAYDLTFSRYDRKKN